MVNDTAATAASFETVIRHRHRPTIGDARHVVYGSSNSESADSAPASVGSAGSVDDPRPQTTVAGEWGLGIGAVSAELL